MDLYQNCTTKCSSIQSYYPFSCFQRDCSGVYGRLSHAEALYHPYNELDANNQQFVNAELASYVQQLQSRHPDTQEWHGGWSGPQYVIRPVPSTRARCN